MKLATHRRAAELFSSVCDLPPDEQTAALTRLRREDPELAQLLDELLGCDRVSLSQLDRSAFARFAPPAAGAPTQVGAYRIVQRLGAGGMGVVYEAEQEHTQRRVALKLLRPGFATPELLARFEREARLLARLSHPGIAHVYEAGTADSDAGTHPYFAMELVRGEPLNAFAEQRDLPTRERIELVARVCDAVQHAHEHGVVHRDLKPSNILVDASGQPRVLDFGVARATDSDLRTSSLHTEVGQLVGTLAYMSPEQVEADPSRIDARSDVYALGAIAYELVSGRLPHDVAGQPIHEAARTIVERDATALGTLDRRWRGDLETIVAKSMAKERERRYASAAALAADLRHWLADEPIVARPASASYHVAKFARRNRTLVAGVAAVIVALAAGVVVSTRMYLRAEDSRANERALRIDAEDAAATLRATNDYFLGLLASPNPLASGADVRMVEVLDAAAAKLDGAFVDRPAQRVQLLATLGQTYLGLGLAVEARRHLEAALALALEHQPDDFANLARLRQDLSTALFELNDFAASLEMTDAALAAFARVAEPDVLDLSFALRSRASVLIALGRWPEAEPLAREATAMLEAHPSATAVEIDAARRVLASVLLERGEYDLAEALCRRSIDELAAAGQSENYNALMAMNMLGAVLHKQSKNREALPWMERTLVATRRAAGDDHPHVATQINNLATLLRSIGELERAEELYREAVALSRRQWTAPHLDIAMKLGNLGSLLVDRDRLDEAFAVLGEADAMLRELLGEKSLQRAFVRWYTGAAYERAGDLDAAFAAFEEALALRREFLPPDHAEITRILRDVARVEALRGHAAEGIERYREALSLCTEGSGERDARTVLVASELALALADAGEHDEAVQTAHAALRIVEEDFADRPDMLAVHRADFSWCLFRAGKLEESEPLLRRALDELAAIYRSEHRYVVRQRERVSELESALAR